MTALELSKKYRTLLGKYGINTSLRLAHFFAQLEHESGLMPISENLNYSAEGLVKTFKKYFPSIASTAGYARNPQKIANKVYANRMGNGNEASGDGWKYRGRSMLQVTGKDNYKALSLDTGVDYIKNPDLLLNESDALVSATWYWDRIKANKLADRDDLDAISDLINIGRDTAVYGDSNGFEDRKAKLAKNKKIFGA